MVTELLPPLYTPPWANDNVEDGNSAFFRDNFTLEVYHRDFSSGKLIW